MRNQHQIECKFVPNSTKKVHNLHHTAENCANKVPKGASSKLHKFLVGYYHLNLLISDEFCNK